MRGAGSGGCKGEREGWGGRSTCRPRGTPRREIHAAPPSTVARAAPAPAPAPAAESSRCGACRVSGGCGGGRSRSAWRGYGRAWRGGEHAAMGRKRVADGGGGRSPSLLQQKQKRRVAGGVVEGGGGGVGRGGNAWRVAARAGDMGRGRSTCDARRHCDASAAPPAAPPPPSPPPPPPPSAVGASSASSETDCDARGGDGTRGASAAIPASIVLIRLRRDAAKSVSLGAGRGSRAAARRWDLRCWAASPESGAQP